MLGFLEDFNWSRVFSKPGMQGATILHVEQQNSSTESNMDGQGPSLDRGTCDLCGFHNHCMPDAVQPVGGPLDCGRGSSIPSSAPSSLDQVGYLWNA